MASRHSTDGLEPPKEIYGGYAYYQRQNELGWIVDCRRRIGVGANSTWDGREQVLRDWKVISDECGSFADMSPLKVSDDGTRIAYTVDTIGDEA